MASLSVCLSQGRYGYWEPHMRGDEKKGNIEKDYKLKIKE